jgi:hypothetical protein
MRLPAVPRNAVHVVLAMLAAVLVALPGQADTTVEMLSRCRPIAEGVVRGDSIEFRQDTQTMQCWGAFLVIAKGVTYSWHGARIWSTCVPGEARRAELVGLFVKYADEHPELMQEDFVDVALESLQVAFPCR